MQYCTKYTLNFQFDLILFLIKSSQPLKDFFEGIYEYLSVILTSETDDLYVEHIINPHKTFHLSTGSTLNTVIIQIVLVLVLKSIYCDQLEQGLNII